MQINPNQNRGLKFRAYQFVSITLIIISVVDYLVMCHRENKVLNANYRVIFEPAASVVYLARLHPAPTMMSN